MDNVVGNDVWDFFCVRLPRNEKADQKQRSMYSEIEWAVQVEVLNSKLTRSTITRCEEDHVAIRIPLMTQIFELTIKKSDNFPEEEPQFKGDFIDGFHTFEWNSQSTLLELTERITDFLVTVDIAILEIKEADIDGFQMIKLETDEEENHLLVQIRATKYKETLILSLDIEDFRSFPRVLRCSNSSRTKSFDCEKWSSDDKLGLNLRRLYGEMDERHVSATNIKSNINIDGDSFEEAVEIMDFI